MSADVVTPEARSRMMAGIRGKDTKPELLIRSALHRAGFRFRLHQARLPGKPDLVLPRYEAAIFVHGCFWHGHDCHLFRWPTTREAFWREKIGRNIVRDSQQMADLAGAGWRVAVIRECALKGKTRLHFPDIVEALGVWLKSAEKALEIQGDETRGAR
jgi:DNA mismatch endonuclease (patch repair protein)